MAGTRGFTGRRRDADPRLPPGQHDTGSGWPVLTAEVTPSTDLRRWTLTVDGRGSGVVPLVSMLRHARAEGRPDQVCLVSAARTLDRLPYADELVAFAEHASRLLVALGVAERDVRVERFGPTG